MRSWTSATMALGSEMSIEHEVIVWPDALSVHSSQSPAVVMIGPPSALVKYQGFLSAWCVLPLVVAGDRD